MFSEITNLAWCFVLQTFFFFLGRCSTHMTIHPRYRFCNIPKYPLYHCLTWSANEFYVYNVYRDMGEELLTEAKLTQGQPHLWSPHQHEWQLTKPRNLRYGLQTACNSKDVSLLSRLFSCSEILLDSVTDIFFIYFFYKVWLLSASSRLFEWSDHDSAIFNFSYTLGKWGS